MARFPGRNASATSGSRERRGARLRLLGGAFLLLALGFALGRIAASSDSRVVEAPAAISGFPRALTLPSPAFKAPRAETERTEAGAARAAARALASLADPRLLTSRERRRSVVAEMAPATYRAELDPLFDRTYEYLAGILGRPAQDGEVILRMTPLGYRVEAFSARRATVAIWQVTLLATPARSAIAAWSTSRAELVWSGGRWRVERFGVDTPGPTPAVTAPSAANAPGDFVALARNLSPFAP